MHGAFGLVLEALGRQAMLKGIDRFAHFSAGMPDVSLDLAGALLAARMLPLPGFVFGCRGAGDGIVRSFLLPRRI